MFNDILGNEEIKIILQNLVNTNSISHSYIFVGKDGIGKFLFAKEFAKAILCNGLNNKPCNKCESCATFQGGNNPDITIIDSSEKSIKTETIKEMVKSVYEKPLKSQKKVYIINNSQKMTREAQNSLLKTLEEPPEYVVLILITENENLLLNTIKSRCVKIKFNNLSKTEVKKILEEKYDLKEIPENILELAEGSASFALSAIDKQDIISNVTEIFSRIDTISIIDLLNKKDLIFKEKENVQEILNFINIELIKNKNIKYLNCINFVEETKERLRKNSNYDMTIDNLLLKIWEEING